MKFIYYYQALITMLSRSHIPLEKCSDQLNGEILSDLATSDLQIGRVSKDSKFDIFTILTQRCVSGGVLA